MTEEKKVYFSQNPISGQIESYDENGVFLGIIETMGNSLDPDWADREKKEKEKKKMTKKGGS